MSFVMLTESQLAPTPNLVKQTHRDSANERPTDSNRNGSADKPGASLSTQVESAKQLFEILSSRSDIDHPICSECTELLLSSLQARLNASTRERDAYISFLKSLNNNAPSSTEVTKAQSSLASSRAAESKAFAELMALEEEKAILRRELAKLEADALALDHDEEAFWRSRNAFTLELSKYQNERDALNMAYEHDSQQLERLQRTNVYNDTFSIGHDGFFGTINGLRLGRLPPPQNVDWAEINAAWGTAALLLATVAEKLGFNFRGYKIRPMGSTSTIERFDGTSPQQSTTSTSRLTTSASHQPAKGKSATLDLFSSGDMPLGRMILHRRLDAGMVSFLECLRQLGEFVEKGQDNQDQPSSSTNLDPRDALSAKDVSLPRAALQLPYKIQKDKIGETSIKLSASSDEVWTRACKYTLTCCKYLLAHASNVSTPASR